MAGAVVHSSGSISREFVVFILGRTCEEWKGRLSPERLNGRAGFRDYGSPEDVVAALEILAESSGGPGGALFDLGAFRAARRVVLCLVDSCQPLTGRVDLDAVSPGGRALALDCRRLKFADLSDARLFVLDREAAGAAAAAAAAAADTGGTAAPSSGGLLPIPHLVLHDRRTLGIFAFNGCLTCLCTVMAATRGTVLLHGLKADALEDTSQENRTRLLRGLREPPQLPVIPAKGHGKGDSSDGDGGAASVTSVFGVDVWVEFEDRSSGPDEEDEADYRDSDGQNASGGGDVASGGVWVFVECHPEDSAEDLRLRLFDLRRRSRETAAASTTASGAPGSVPGSAAAAAAASVSLQPAPRGRGRGWRIPMGFALCRAPSTWAELPAELPAPPAKASPQAPPKAQPGAAPVKAATESAAEEAETATKSAGSRPGAAGVVAARVRAPGGGAPWFPGRHPSLAAALAAHRLDDSGRGLRRACPAAASAAAAGAGDNEALPFAGARREGPRWTGVPAIPVLRAHGTPYSPLRRFALACALGADFEDESKARKVKDRLKQQGGVLVLRRLSPWPCQLRSGAL
mmetsp:Transcript_15055/g.35433  ORF Transcript_15055/g.35433 Transcript_15055/m.35433 type:complete len:575 (+) Transcript_15055:238-1962(+)